MSIPVSWVLLLLLLLVGHSSNTRTADAFLLPGRPRSSQCTRWSPSSGIGAPRRTAAAALHAAAVNDAASPPPPPWARLFDPEKAIKLAAFSFATYGDPSGSRWMRMPDGTDLGFQNDEVVRRNFKALLLVHILTASNLPQESGGLLERALSGASCDPYVVTSVPNSFGADVAITRPKAADSNPEFYERFFLYVEDPGAAGAALELTVKDKNLLRGDDVIGTCRLPLSELRALGEGDDEEGDGDMSPVLEWSGTLDIVSPSGKPSGSIELELQLVSLEDNEEADSAGAGATEEDADEQAEAPAWGPGPKSVLEGINWNELGQKMGGTAMGLGRFQFACFLTNEETDTQGAIWCDPQAKEMIVSFRGTQMEWKDLLTDMLIIQEGLDAPDDERKIHAGFRRAFRSVREAALQAIKFIAPDIANDAWTIDCTGHSLGGALATLMAHELDRQFPFLAPQGRLHMVSFGAPRVGNAAFCEDYDRRLRDVSFRVVNGLDVVARMPRGTKQPNLLEYAHCGKTVLLTGSGEAGDRFSVWVEGESEGTCPLREVDPFARAPGSGSGSSGGPAPSSSSFDFQFPVSLGMVNGSAASVQDMLRAASNMTNLQAMLSPTASAASTGPFGTLSLQTDFNQLKGAILSGALNGTALAAKSILGLDDKFVDAELQLMESLILGDALAHHMEPLYYVALAKAFTGLEQRDGDRAQGSG